MIYKGSRTIKIYYKISPQTYTMHEYTCDKCGNVIYSKHPTTLAWVNGKIKCINQNGCDGILK